MAVVSVAPAGLEVLDWMRQVHHDLYVASGMYAPVFDDYVARSFTTFVEHHDPALDQVWVAASDAGERIGAIAIQHSRDRPRWVQIRWFFVLPGGRGAGVGRRLLDEALAWARSRGFNGVHLWTMDGLHAARSLYEKAGFRLVEEAPAPWHATLRQQRFEMQV